MFVYIHLMSRSLYERANLILKNVRYPLLIRFDGLIILLFFKEEACHWSFLDECGLSQKRKAAQPTAETTATAVEILNRAIQPMYWRRKPLASSETKAEMPLKQTEMRLRTVAE